MFDLFVEYADTVEVVTFKSHAESVFYAGVYLCDPAVWNCQVVHSESLDVLYEQWNVGIR